MRQLIIARKDLNMSTGKLAAQVSHASMAFLSHMIREGGVQKKASLETGEDGVGRMLTCIGFRPLPDETAHAISRKDQLFKQEGMMGQAGRHVTETQEPDEISRMRKDHSG